jgi:hypothetical protein
MNRSGQKKVIIIIAFSIIFITIALSFYYRQNQSTQNVTNAYASYLKSITDKSVNLTRAYQDEIAIWNAHQYSNATMSKITEAYLPKFMSQLDQFKNTSAPAKYSKVKEDYIKSFESEIKSYQLFDVYLKTNNATANKLSTDYLSLALSFETMARNDFTLAINNNSSANSNINNNTNNSINKNPNIGNNSNQLFLQQPIVLCNQIKNHIGIQLIYPYNPLL